VKATDFECYYDQVYNKEQMTAVKAMKKLDVSKSTFYRGKQYKTDLGDKC
jgi:ACT domain-containing protein